MVGIDRFSRRGEPATEFEVQLLTHGAVDADNVWLEIGRQLVVDLGLVAGVAALLVVLDTLGTEKVHVPSRAAFFQRLYRPRREADILEMLEEDGASLATVSHAVRLSKSRVSQIHKAVKRSGRRYRAKRVCNRA
jgi:hypothetical protein